MKPGEHSPTWQLIGDVLLSGWTPAEFQSDRWREYLEMLQDERVRISMALVRGSVTISANQRGEAAEALKKRGLPVVVLTDSRFTRGMLTALSWLGAKIRGFSWADIDKALEATGSSADVQAQLRESAKDFEQATKDVND